MTNELELVIKIAEYSIAISVVVLLVMRIIRGGDGSGDAADTAKGVMAAALLVIWNLIPIAALVGALLLIGAVLVKTAGC